MNDLVALASELGRKIASHPIGLALVAARRTVTSDAEAQTLMKTHSEVLERIQSLRQQQKPIEPEDKRRLAECEASMASHPAFKALLRAQADYVDLMNQIHRAIEGQSLESRSEGAGRP